MSISLPSIETYVIDVPEVKNAKSEFRYNYFVPDEGVTEDGTIPRAILEKAGETVDAKFIETVAQRIPRFVRLTWSPVIVNSENKNVDEEQRLSTRLNFNINSKLISENIDKVMDESTFAAKNFTSINLNDQSIDRKLYTEVSGSAAFLNDERFGIEKGTQQKLALATDAITSDDVTFKFLSTYLVQPSENNVFYYEKNSQRITNDLVNKLKDVNLNIQLNNKFAATLLGTQISSPHSVFSDQFVKSYSIATNVQKGARAQTQRDLSADDYRTFGTHIEAFTLKSTYTVSSDVHMVGYIIDKYTVNPDRTLKKVDSIAIEDPAATSTIDPKIRYYGKYIYTIKSVALYTIPSIVQDTGELVVAKFLISSRPSKQMAISCVELVPPPVPADLKFIWDYDEVQLNVTWSFPTTSQRDVKKFQVFRRKSISEPFQMLRIVDFDDSVLKADETEAYFPQLVSTETNPRLRFIDPEFGKDSRYIYAVCSIDAHGMTSGYSEQYEISFDRFKNRTSLKRISASGAPKPYPNMFLLQDTFLDSIVVSGYKKLKVAFDPDHYAVYDNSGNDLRFMASSRTNGKYRFQFINTDLQKQNDVNITIDDLRPIDADTAKQQRGS